MKAVITKTTKLAKTNAAVPIAAEKSEPTEISARVLKRGTCQNLAGKNTLGFEIGVNGRGEVLLRVVENSGTGSFSDDWVPFKAIQAALDKAPKSEPISAYVLNPLWRGKSSNCCYFCVAVLKSEGLLLPSEKRKKRFDRVDPAAWLADVRSRAENRSADATGEKNNKKPAVPKAGASKPKKGNKPAKT